MILQDRYEIIAEIGRGGMSVVYLARDRVLGSFWAVKQVKNQFSEAFHAFKKEVELLAGLAHSEIPRIVDRIEYGDDYYVVMDFVDGTSLGKKVQSEGPASEEEIVDWGKQLCSVFIYLHEHAADLPIIYCDLKPDNVMLTQAGQIRLIDFGIARKCVPGERCPSANVGTKGYAAPEQYRGGSHILDPRTDIYSFGATLFYLATAQVPGVPPRGVPRLREVNPALSEGLEYVIQKCCQDNPARRYQRFTEVLDDLQNIKLLNARYRQKMKGRIAVFAIGIVLTLASVGAIFIGKNGINASLQQAFEEQFHLAKEAEQKGDDKQAAEHYYAAISNKPDDYESYIRLFNVLLPDAEDQDVTTKTKSAIDEMRKRYLDNRQSKKYKDPLLGLRVARSCLDVNDPVYAQYAVDYLELAPAEAEGFSEAEIKAYKVIAAHSSGSMKSQDFEAFAEALQTLEQVTDTPDMPIDEKLSNYDLLIQMYATYPDAVGDAQEKIYSIGNKARELIEANRDSEEMTFNNIIRLYKTVASSLSTWGTIAEAPQEKEQAFQRSLEWFEHLEALNVDLDSQLLLKKGNTHRGIYDIYNAGKRTDAESDVDGPRHLKEAIDCYQELLITEPNHFLANVYLTRALLDNELLKDAEKRNYEKTRGAYKRVSDLMSINEGQLTNIELNQFAALKEQMEGLEKEQTEGLEED